MKNFIKFGIIVFVAIINFSLVSCGGIDSGLEGTWKLVEDNDFIIKISKNNFSIKDEKKGDEVITKNDIITVKFEGKEVGKAYYAINLSMLSFSGGTGFFKDALPSGTYKK